MTSSLLLLALNGYLAILSGFAFLIFAHYLGKNYKYGYNELRPAIALTTLWLGEIILRFPLFLARAHMEAGHPVGTPMITTVIGGGLIVISILCVIRVFSPDRWNHVNWILALTASTAVVVITAKMVQG